MFFNQAEKQHALNRADNIDDLSLVLVGDLSKVAKAIREQYV